MYSEETGPVPMNAFQLIAMSGSLDLSGFFEEEVWFVSWLFSLQGLNAMEGGKGGSSTPSYRQAVVSRGKKSLETARSLSGEGKRCTDEA